MIWSDVVGGGVGRPGLEQGLGMSGPGVTGLVDYPQAPGSPRCCIPLPWKVPGDSGVTTDSDRSSWWPLWPGLLPPKERRPRSRNPKGELWK